MTGLGSEQAEPDEWVNVRIEIVMPLDDVGPESDPLDKQASVGVQIDHLLNALPEGWAYKAAIAGEWADTTPFPMLIDATCSSCNSDGKGKYRTQARCGNCGWEGMADHSLGHETRDREEDCPRCECRRIYMGDYIGPVKA